MEKGLFPLPNPDAVDPSKPESIAGSLLPMLGGSRNKGRFIALRAMGWTFDEAVDMLQIPPRTVFSWRDDPQFVELEARVSDIKSGLAEQAVRIEWLRILSLMMDYDSKVAVKMSKGSANASEVKYFDKIRPLYNPVQLQTLNRLVAGDLGEEPGGYEELVLRIRRRLDSRNE